MNVSHLIRDVVVAIVGLIALLAAAVVLEGGALAVVVAILALWAVLAVMPLVVIHYDRHQPGKPGAHSH